MESISVIFPAYNQATCIEQVVMNAIDVASEITDDYEIIIVNDASTDNMQEIVTMLSRNNSHVRMLLHDKRVGHGQSLREGFEMAQKDILVYADPDLYFNLDDIKKAVRAMKFAGADIISAYRLNRTREGFFRQFIFFVYNFMVRFLFQLPIRDINFSFKLLKKQVLNAITLNAKGAFIDTEFLVKSHKKGFSIHQIGVDCFYRQGVLTMITPQLFWDTVREIFRLIKETRRMKSLKDETTYCQCR
ncbi:MAG: glycosyltransferase family 2 protein [bacterium]|nr:glycosyltransferase family 2 protein [bacterium]